MSHRCLWLSVEVANYNYKGILHSFLFLLRVFYISCIFSQRQQSPESNSYFYKRMWEVRLSSSQNTKSVWKMVTVVSSIWNHTSCLFFMLWQVNSNSKEINLVKAYLRKRLKGSCEHHSGLHISDEMKWLGTAVRVRRLFMGKVTTQHEKET